MSTKLYNGLRLTDHAPDIYTVTQLVAQCAREVFQQLAAEIIAELVADIVDAQQLRDDILAAEKSVPESLYTAAEKRWLDQQQKLNPHTTFHDPLRFNIVFGEVAVEPTPRRLAYVFAGRGEYLEALKNLTYQGEPVFVDYHFQNQSDRPAGITKLEWKQRRTDWDSVTTTSDPETNGTFGHLPGWSLPDTIRGVFGMWLFWKEPGELKLDEHRTQTQRFIRALEKAAWDQIWCPDDFDESERRSAGIRISLELQSAVRAVLRKHKSWAEEAKPDPLPADLSTSIAELPPAYEPPTEFVEIVIARFRAREKERS